MRAKRNLSGRVAIVTGASRGLGKAIALRLADAGAAVAVNYARDAAGAEAVARAIADAGGLARPVMADVSDAAAVATMVADVDASLGPPEILVANAGFAEPATLFDLDAERWQRMLDVVLKGPFLCAKAVLPAMAKVGRGRIVTTSSDAGKKGGEATGPHYSAAKAGVLGLMMGLARQLASHDVTVNDVCPMDIPTERWQGRSPERLASILSGIPRGRFGTPADVAGAVAYLVSDEAAHVTGTSIDVSGGAILK